MKLSESWEEEGRERTRGPFKGRLANEVRLYPGSFNLKLIVQIKPVGQRPLFFLDDKDHPLAFDQENGIKPETAAKMGMQLLHNLP